MSTHETGQLGAYCLGALETADAAELERHLATCPDCRRELDELEDVHEQMRLVPPEVLLDGAAEDSDLLFARIMRAAEQITAAERQLTAEPTVTLPAAGKLPQIPRPAPPADPTVQLPPATPELPTTIIPKRTAKKRPWYRGPLAAAAAVVLLAGVFAGGILAGHLATPPSATAMPTGTRTISATDPATGVGMSMQLIPSSGWVTLEGHFSGVTPGTPCEIYVVSKTGERVLAGGWVAPPNANTAVITVDGSAIMDPGDIGSVEIDTSAGKHLVTAPV